MLEAFKIGVSISVIDHASMGLVALSRNFMQTEADALALEKRIKSIKSLAIGGGIMAGAGIFGLSLFKAPLDEAIKYEQQLNKIKALNLDMRFGIGSTKGLEQFALAISQNTKGTTQTEALKLVTETQSITGDILHTKELVPALSKMRFGMETYMSALGKGEGHGAQSSKQFADIIKVMEMRGLMRDFSEAKMNNLADLFTKNYVASGGMVKPSDFLAMMKTGGVAGKSIGEDFLFAMGHIIQETGGSRAGTQLMSGYQNLVAGRMPQQVAETLNKLGLLQKDALHYGKTGHITKVDPGGLAGSELFRERPDLYMTQYILPALKKSGVDITNQNEVLMRLNSLAGQRTATNELAQLFIERGQIANYISQAKNAKGNESLYQQGVDSTVGKQIDLMAKRNTLELELGRTVLQAYVKGLEILIPALKSTGDWMNKNSDLVKMLALGFAGLFGVMVLRGSILLLTAAFKWLGLVMAIPISLIKSFALAIPMLGRALLMNPIGLTITAIAAAAYLLYKNWDTIAPKLNAAWGSIKSGINSLINWITSAWGSVKALMPGFITNSHTVTPGMRPPGYIPGISQKTQSEVSGFLADSLLNGKDKTSVFVNQTPVFAKSAQPEPSKPNYISPASSNKSVQVHTQINLDGRKIAETITKHQSKSVMKPQSGSSMFDYSRAAPSVGMGY